MEDLEKKGIQGQRRKEIVFAYLGDRAKVKEHPIVASFELTPLCNFDCKMCYVHLNKTQMGGRSLLTVAQWKQIIDMSVDAGIMAADITGGECLTYPGFKEVYLHLLSHGIQPCILTNGSLLTPEIVSFFAQYPPKLIQITVYGSNKYAYQQVTGKDMFAEVMAGITRLKEARLPVHLVITPNRFMQEDYVSLLAHMRSLGIPYDIGGLSLPARPDTKRHLDDYEIDAAVFAQLQKNETEYRKSIAASFSLEEAYPLRMKASGQRNGAPCGAAHNHFHVNWKGEMSPCISFYGVTSPMMEIGFDAAWKDIISQMQKYHEPNECLSCKYRQECSSCPAEKCSGIPGEKLNERVCRRMQEYDKAGLLNQLHSRDCI